MGLTAELPSLPPIRREPQITYLDRSGAVIGVRGGRYGPPLNIDRLPPYVPAAFVAIEDRRFYSHAGIDPLGMARALMADLGAGRAAQGGSTITQQLARNLYLTSDQTLERKGQEMIYAAELERVYSKKQILGLYLSRIYFGSGAYGIEAAAHRYFNKPAERLTLREAAMLAAIPKSPTAYDPAEQPARSAERTALVLAAMVETGAITAGERARALARPAKVWPNAQASAGQYFIDWVDGPVRRTLGAAKTDVVVDTTLDLPAELAAGQAAKAVVGRFARAGVSQAAVVAMDGNGRVRVLIGGIDHDSGPYDRAVSAHRQAGSSWKPFVYLTAMEAGRTPDTMVVDEPVTIAGWSPRDFEPEFMGPVTLQTALAHSLNTVAVRLADEIGRPNVVAAAHRVGIVSPIGTEPAMALGAELVTPLEMAQAYDAFSNGGARVSAYGIERIRTASGRLIFRHQGPAPQPAIANPALTEMNQMLRTVITAGTGTRAAIAGYDLAGKTGTTSDFRDAWFCGYTGGLTTVVWMGRDDNAPMRGITGGSAPTELWRQVMRAALPRLPHGPIPAGAPAPVPLVPVAQPLSPTSPEPAPEPTPDIPPT
ncbi:MAG TPA: PBP1A family penicillin-binding protein [Caulobacteraceae bacterium]